MYLLGSDMELDLLAAAETESDSESNHSNQDNASGRRSVVTAATAGSEAGMVQLSLTLRLCIQHELLKLYSVYYAQGWQSFYNILFSYKISKEGTILVTFLLF